MSWSYPAVFSSSYYVIPLKQSGPLAAIEEPPGREQPSAEHCRARRGPGAGSLLDRIGSKASSQDFFSYRGRVLKG